MISKPEYQLIGLIYDAALDVSLWPAVLKMIVELSNSDTAILTALDQLNPNYELTFTYNIPQEVMIAYRDEHLNVIDMQVHGQKMINGGIGSPLQIVANYGLDHYINTPIRGFYDKCLEPANIYYMGGVLLEYEHSRWSVLAVHRPKSKPAYTEAELKFIGDLSLHIRRSIQIYRQIVSLQSQNIKFNQLFDQMAVGVILLNERQEVRYANKLAEQLLSKRSVLKVDQEHHLKTNIKQQHLLNQLIRSVIYGLEKQVTLAKSGGVIDLSNEHGEVELILTVSPLSEVNSPAGDKSVYVAVFLTDPYAKYKLSATLLKQIYSLSLREIYICEVFINHPTLEQTAKICGLTMATIRTYMKKIYEKTQQHSQAELLHLLMGFTLKFEHIH